MMAVYRVIEELIKSGVPLREQDLIERTGLSETIGDTLDSLGYSEERPGFIDYESPSREIQGRRPSGWAIYKAKESVQRADPEDVYQRARKIREGFHSKTDLVNVLDHVKKNSDKEFTGEKVAETVEISPKNASSCLSILSDLGYLESTFNGKTLSRAAANKYTRMFWREFLEPIGIVAQTMDPTLPEFRSALEYYSSHNSEREAAIRRQMGIYNNERSNIGPEGGEILRDLVLSVLATEPKKASQIAHEINARSERKLKSNTISIHLRAMAKKRIIAQTGRGYYALRRTTKYS